MSEKTETIGLIVNMLQQADMRELDLIWRILYGMLNGKEGQQHENQAGT